VPETTLHAWGLEREGELIVGATPGGVNQLPWNAQTVTELLGGAAIGAAVTNPRWALDEQDELSAEEGAPIADGIAVARRVGRLSHRSVQQVVRLSADGLHSAAADPRTGACALAVY
jgi:gamma-glutamyltranspeptidase/glutathione hydrolase